ncbi:hypothetical protein Syun_010416 [Stephania yunnanensis]|uniref:Uncharacterized protein n=1 Tax=Stephania yunnanensis TaxID=152371 RepID=A0AAP0PPY6_9MAGN
MNTMSTPFRALRLIALLLYILSFAPHHHHSISTTTAAIAAHDTMFAGQSLTINQTLVSRNGKFELGFFTPGNSKKYYIGIWFKQVAAIQKKKTVVWVANRNNPIATDDSFSSEFKLLENGGLVLLILVSSSNIPVWSTNSTTSRAMNDSSVEVVLGDDANLVISSSSNRRRSVIWQSFDHPTNAFLPGLKLGYNNVTKKGSKLTSWRNSEDPSDGIYSFEWWADRSFNIIWNNSYKFYTSGVWNGRFFGSVPEMNVGHGLMSSFEFTSKEDGSYEFTYFLSNKSLPLNTFLDTSGQMKSIVWSTEARDWTIIWSKPLRRCQVYGVCGAFAVCSENNICQCLSGFTQRYPKDWGFLDYSGGCVRKTSLQCSNGDSFTKMSNIRLPDQISTSANALVVDIAKKCELACLQNCSCKAYAYATNSSSSSTSSSSSSSAVVFGVCYGMQIY